MGVPALFRWLSKKYPRIISAVEEEEPRRVPRQDGQDGDEELPIDMSGRNPNGEEFDSLYLDMNGIVHPCTHPEGKPAPETEEEMMLEVFAYTERVVNMVRPRKLLMMAIDGVAPRAKMNQQRSRRFRTAQEAKEKEEETKKALEEWKSMGLPVTDDAKEQKKAWDSNAITPGTPFMDLLASSLRFWVRKKLNTDPGWKNLQVVISDASVPGEGEHKIMDFIRRQRAQPDHDANTKHVIYGLDADLIMLSLATHEPYFKVLREDVFAQEQKVRKCHRCGREGHIAANCIGEPKEKAGKNDDVGAKPPEKKPFIFLDVVVLREYLEVELDIPGLPFKFNLERAIDDWVFLIFFVGNDFLPHLPSLEIREGAIDTLLKIWKTELPRMGSYLTNHGKVELKNAQIILEGIAKEEDEIFRRRKQQEDRQESNSKRRKVEDEARQRRELGMEKDFKYGDQSYVEPQNRNGHVDKKAEQEQADLKAQAIAALESGKNEDIIANQRAIRMANLSAAERLKAELKGSQTRKGDAEGPAIAKEEVDAEEPSAVKADAEAEEKPRGQKRGIEQVESQDSAAIAGGSQETEAPVAAAANNGRVVNPDGTVEYPDTVKLYEPGYRERYYQQKFGIGIDDVEFRRKVVKCYMEGMAWVLAYYYQGCPSWTWYYPYHFSPFAADFTNLDEFTIEFDEGKPFRPYDQLMGVLPASSRASIPPIFHSLMTDEDSEIIDFYPENFAVDMNGKKMAWQGVALLPFIDEKRLLEAINSRYSELSEDEIRRNLFGNHALLIAEESQLYDDICALYAKKRSDDAQAVPVDPDHSGGIAGLVKPDPDCVPGSTFYSPLAKVGVADLQNDRSISALYDFPPQTTPHRSILLKGVVKPKRVLTHEEREITRRGGAGQRGGGRGGRGGGGGGGGRFSSGSYNHHSMHMDEQNQRRSVAMGGSGAQPHRYGNGPAAPQQQQYNAGYGNGHAQAPSYGQPHYGGPPPVQAGGGYQNGYGGGGYGGGAYGQPQQALPAGPAADVYGGYGGYGGYGSAAPQRYDAPAPPASYGGGYGGQGGGYGGYGGAGVEVQGGAAAAYGGGGAYGAPPQRYGGGATVGAPAAYGGGYAAAGGYQQPAQQYQAPPQQYGGGGQAARGGAVPRPMGYRTGGGGGGRGGRGGNHGRY